MQYLGTLTSEEAEKLGVPRSVLVISPTHGVKSKASTSFAIKKPNAAVVSNSAPSDPMRPAMKSFTFDGDAIKKD